MYALLEHSFYTRANDAQRTVFRFPASVAPTKVLILPLSSNAVFEPLIERVQKYMRSAGLPVKVDASTGSIGRRYARNDEMGTPFAITVDFASVDDGTITLRERDSMSQIRASVEQVCEVVAQLCAESTTWAEVQKKYPVFVTAPGDD